MQIQNSEINNNQPQLRSPTKEKLCLTGIEPAPPFPIWKPLFEPKYASMSSVSLTWQG